MQAAVTESVAFQRGTLVKEEEDAGAAIRARAARLSTLDAGEQDAFSEAVKPLYAEAKKTLSGELFKLV